MNDDIQVGLQVIVERAVRPVCAGTSRKRAMREELLAHVTAIFDEETARRGDERAALARTAERFGDPAELTAELEASVPLLDGVERVADALWFNPGEPTLLRAIRLALLCEAIALLVTFFLWTQPMNGVRFGTIQPIATALLGIAILAFSITYLSAALREVVRAPSRETWLPAALAGLGSSLAVYGFLLLTGAGPAEFGTFVGLACSLAIIAFFSWATAAIFDIRIREHEEWAGLELE